MLSIPKTLPDTLTFKPNKIRVLLWSIGVWSFLILFEISVYWATYVSGDPTSDGTLAFWLMLLVMPVLLFYNVISLLPKEGHLTIDKNGFELYSHLKSRHHKYKWEDVQGFFLTHQADRYFKHERVTALVTIAGIATKTLSHLPLPYFNERNNPNTQ